LLVAQQNKQTKTGSSQHDGIRQFSGTLSIGLAIWFPFIFLDRRERVINDDCLHGLDSEMAWELCLTRLHSPVSVAQKVVQMVVQGNQGNQGKQQQKTGD